LNVKPLWKKVKIGASSSHSNQSQLEFHVHTNTSQLVVGAILAQNPNGRFDQLVMYSFILLNSIERNYTPIEREKP